MCCPKCDTSCVGLVRCWHWNLDLLKWAEFWSCWLNHKKRLKSWNKIEILKSWEFRYRFSWNPISTYLSLTLARLCGNWQFVSKNYEARSGKYKARIAIFCILATDYFYRGISQFWLKYEARIAIFCILAAIDRFSRISQKVESHWEKVGKPLKKLESRWGKLESHYRN